MNERPQETVQAHSRLLKCGLDVETSRAFWSRSTEIEAMSAKRAFDEYWFGARSLARTKVLLAEMKSRYVAFPTALVALGRWHNSSPESRLLICHWHAQLADPLYRAFTGDTLPDRRAGSRPMITRDVVVDWVRERVGDRWSGYTRVLYASKLLSAGRTAGLIKNIRDPRTLTVPRVPEDALEYLMYLLRGLQFKGTLLENPYVRSVGFDPTQLEHRLRRLPGMKFSRQGTLCDFGWQHPDLIAWADDIASSRRARATRGRR